MRVVERQAVVTESGTAGNAVEIGLVLGVFLVTYAGVEELLFQQRLQP